MSIDHITVLILTFNEAPNIGRVLERLTWAGEVVIVDSGSTDGTQEITSKFPNVRVLSRAFDSFANQRNYGLQNCRTDWVLSLDADYVLSRELVGELTDFHPGTEVSALNACFAYCIEGRRLRSSLYPPRPVLFRKSASAYEGDGHSERLHVEGAIGRLKGVILHDDRKPLSHWLWAQERYARLECEKILAAPMDHLSLPDRLRRRIIIAPILVFFYTLFAKRLLLDGWPGFYYVLQRTYAELLLSLLLLEKRFSKRSDEGRPSRVEGPQGSTPGSNCGTGG
ncbi:MAG: glycosyltransferase family 2 protein [Verrucomicrobiota bacterium]